MTEPTDPFAQFVPAPPPRDPFARYAPRPPAGGATAGVGAGGGVGSPSEYGAALDASNAANRAANDADTARTPLDVFMQGNARQFRQGLDQVVHSGDYRRGMAPDQAADPGQVLQGGLDIASGVFGMVAAPFVGAVDAIGGRGVERALNLQPDTIGTSAAFVGSFAIPGAEAPRRVRPLPDYVHDAYTDEAPPWRFRDAPEAEAHFRAQEQSTEPGGPGSGAPPPSPEPNPSQPERVYEPRIVAGARIGGDGRFETDANGHVTRAAEPGVEPAPEGPLTFRRPAGAARWIIQNGQRHSVDQMFELANGPEQGTYAIRERARAPQPPEPLPFVQPTETFPEPPPEPAAEPAGAPPGGGEPPGGGTGAEPPEGPPAASPAPLDFVQPVRPRQWHDPLTRPMEKGLVQAGADWLAHAYTGLVSYRHPLHRGVEGLRAHIEELTGAPLEIRPGDDPTKLAAVGGDVFNLGHVDLVDGVRPYRGTEGASPAMHDVVVALTRRGLGINQTPAEALKEFNDYLVARRGIEEWGRFERGELPNPPLPADRGGDRASLEAHLAEAEAAHPHFHALGGEVNEIGRALWTKQFDAGLISQETYLAANSARGFYIPFRRVLEETAHVGAGGASNAASIAKGFKGSERDVIGPLETLARQTYEVNRRVRVNDVHLGLVRLAEQLDALLEGTGETNGVMRKLPTPAKPYTATPEELKSFGIDHLFSDENLTLWRPGEIHENGRPIIYLWREGKREAWELTDPEWAKDLYESLSGMTHRQSDWLLTALSIPANVLRKGVTTHPAFVVPNFFRDAVSQWVLTGHNPLENLGQLFVPDTSAGLDYAAAGGISPGAAVARVGDVAHRGDFLALGAQGLRGRYAANLGSAFNWPDVSEVAGRLALFKAALRRGLESGLTPYDAHIEAAAAARDFLDFGRYGSKMYVAMRIVPFLNGSMQGIDKAVRTLVGEPVEGSLRGILRPLIEGSSDAKAVRNGYMMLARLGALSALSFGLTALSSDDPEYQNIPEYRRASNWFVPFFGHYLPFPKPYELAIPMNIAERSFEAMHFNDPTAWSRLGQDIQNNVILPSDNPVIRTAAELHANQNFRTGHAIVPQALSEMMPGDQASLYTSSFSRWLGRHTNTSPAAIDYAIRGFGGSWGSAALNYSNITDPDRGPDVAANDPLTRRFVNVPFRGSQDETNFFDRMGGRTSELMRRFNSIHEAQLAGNSSRAEQLYNEADPAGRVWLTTQMADTPAVRRLNPLDRARVAILEIDRMNREMMGDRPRDRAAPLPPIDPSTRGVLRDALGRLAVAEARNAMITTGQPGYLHRAPMPREAIVAEIEAIHPGLVAELENRIQHEGSDRAYSYEAVQRLWPQVADRIRSGGPRADLTDLVGRVAGQ